MTKLLVKIKDEREEAILLAFLDNLKFEYSRLGEGGITDMSLAVAQPSFSRDWSIEDKEENAYWNSFVK